MRDENLKQELIRKMKDEIPDSEDSDLLYGMPAIARHLNIRPRQAHHLKEKGGLPIFELGGVLCARRSTLNAWIVEREREAQAGGPVKVKNSGPRGKAPDE